MFFIATFQVFPFEAVLALAVDRAHFLKTVFAFESSFPVFCTALLLFIAFLIRLTFRSLFLMFFIATCFALTFAAAFLAAAFPAFSALAFDNPAFLANSTAFCFAASFAFFIAVSL